MTLAPDTDPNEGVLVAYFNGFGAVGGAAATGLNPNVATLGSAFATAPFHPVALFGIWKDCNRDGFVGLGDNGAMEYSARLLSDASVCVASQPPASHPWLVHNDGAWVVEFVPIGYDDITTPEDEDPLTFNDTTARVWADWGLPGSAAEAVCVTVPTPYGTFRSTGGLLRWLDCFTGFRVADAGNTVARTAGDESLGFQDPERPDQSSSPLNQPNPWGRESDASMARLTDCTLLTEFVLLDPTGGRLHTLASVPIGNGQRLFVNGTDDDGRIIVQNVFAPSPAIDPAGSPAGTVNETEAELTDCDRRDPDEVVDADGRRTGSDGDLPYALEGGGDPVSGRAPRTRTDFAFTFEEGSRGSGAAALALGVRGRDDLGLGTTAVTGLWVATGASTTHDPFVTRSAIGAEPVTYITYYARMNSTIVATAPIRMPSGAAQGTYGGEGCPEGRFECDPALWWRNSAGADVVPRDSRLGVDRDDPTVPDANDPVTAIGVRIGARYQMRDTDCIDTSFAPARDSGVHWGVVTGSACERPAS